MDRITVIKKSLSAFVCGIIGYFPLIGLAPALYALHCWSDVRHHYRDWNPARRYLTWGAVLGGLGLLNSILTLFAIGMALVDFVR